MVLFEALLDKSTMDNRLQESQASVLQHFESWSHSRPSDFLHISFRCFISFFEIYIFISFHDSRTGLWQLFLVSEKS